MIFILVIDLNCSTSENFVSITVKVSGDNIYPN